MTVRSIGRHSLLLIATLVCPVKGRIACEDDIICTEKYRDGSVCVDGTCSNPFASGCLRRYLGEGNWSQPRACNSDDPPGAAEAGVCAQSPLDYEEIRILSGNFDSSMFSSWIMQIALSEMLGVPATIETGVVGLGFNFYDPDNEFHNKSVFHDYDALREARARGDCRTAPKKVSCAHVMPELWDGQMGNIKKAFEEGFIEPPVGTGGVGKFSWFIPKFTARRDPTLLSHFGMSVQKGSEANRRKLADIFKRPFTWGDYCGNFTKDYCATPDKVATRAPIFNTEEDRYFVFGLFTGFFNDTKENDCATTTCTGHIASASCDWTNYVIPQAHYLNIPVKSSGPEIAGGYPDSRLIEIWEAANATKSDVMLYWYRPHPFLQSKIGTDAEFQQILLTPSSLECRENRVLLEQRCSEDPADWIGDEKGSCDSENDPSEKLIVSNLYDIINSVDEASRSPAYDTIKSMAVSELEMNQIFQFWYDRNIDRWNYDPREAVCRWTAENIDQFRRFIPRGYPRSIEGGNSYHEPYLYAATAFGVTVSLLTVAAWVGTWFFRQKRVMKYAQLTFLYLLLCGLLLVCIGAVLITIQPTNATCVSSKWLTVLGYSLILVPLLVKVAALNKMFQSAARMERVTINKKHLYIIVGAFMAVVVIVLTVWTVVDPPSSQEKRVLTNKMNSSGGLVVEISYSCASQSPAWQITVLVYQLILIICATVLAFQSRKIKQEFNESTNLAFVIYTRFLFIVIQVVAWTFSSHISPSILAAIVSFVLSLDSLTTLGIFFIPKLWIARRPDDSSQLRGGFKIARKQNSNVSANGGVRAGFSIDAND